ncbi:hypothetical protein FGB62_300g03 [Gracilaria domingensis]|nr:hypothetical protein FGB62_300g03 [Gracilaria domingensis]
MATPMRSDTQQGSAAAATLYENAAPQVPRAASGARRAGADLVAIPAATNFVRRALRVAQKARSMAGHALRAVESALRMPRIAVAVSLCFGQRACVARLPIIGGALAAVLLGTRVRGARARRACGERVRGTQRLPRIDGAAVRVTSASVDDNRSARLVRLTKKTRKSPPGIDQVRRLLE